MNLNEGAKHWYSIGTNPIPADTRNKKPIEEWQKYQTRSMTLKEFDEFIIDGKYAKGIAIITGRLWRVEHEGKYLIAIDIDNEKGLRGFLTRNDKVVSISEFASKTLVEQHKDDPNRAHIYFISPIPFPSKGSDSKIGLEVKADKQLMFVFPSLHENGHNYEPLGTQNIVVLNEKQSIELMRHIDIICTKYGIKYLEKESNTRLTPNIREMIRKLEIDNAITILEGERHSTLLSIADSLLINHYVNGNKTIDKLKKFFEEINYKLCQPLPLIKEEIVTIWKSAIKFVKQSTNHNIAGNIGEVGGFKSNIKNESIHSNNNGKTIAQILIELASENSTLFKDEFNVPHALVKIKDHYEVLPIEGTKFKRYLFKLYYDNCDNQIPHTESINNAISILQGNAEFEGQTKTLHLRTAWADENNKDTIYYDLSDDKRRCVKITKNNWEILKNQIEILFRRYHHSIPQVEPLRRIGDEIDGIDGMDSKLLDEFLNLLNVEDENNKLLLKCYIISLFIPDIPKPILRLQGEQGSAKSTLQELIKMTVDPSSMRTLTFPRDTNDFIQQLSHNYIVYYDNISTIPEWISDQLCRAVTGSGFSKRALYTNDDDVIYNFKRNIGLNGINIEATKADLLDRSIIVQLERISKEKRRKDEDIWKDFNKLKPGLLAFIFNILVKVLKYRNDNREIRLTGGLNRIADWEEYAEIISRCMGNAEGEFQRVYQENIGVQVDEAISTSPLSMAIVELMKENEIDEDTGIHIKEIEELNDTATELSQKLNDIAETKLKFPIQRMNSWPKSPSHLSRRLNEIKTNLREKGIEIETGKKDANGNRKITIRKVSSMPSMPSKMQIQTQKPLERIDSNEGKDNMPSITNSEIELENTVME